MPGRQAGDARVEPDPRAVAGRSGLVLHRGPPVRYALERTAGQPRRAGRARKLRGPVRRAAVGPYQAERLQPRLFLPARLGWDVQHLLVSGDPPHPRPLSARAAPDVGRRGPIHVRATPASADPPRPPGLARTVLAGLRRPGAPPPPACPGRARRGCPFRRPGPCAAPPRTVAAPLPPRSRGQGRSHGPPTRPRVPRSWRSVVPVRAA